LERVFNGIWKYCSYMCITSFHFFIIKKYEQ
jgi:hypothetical protein